MHVVVVELGPSLPDGLLTVAVVAPVVQVTVPQLHQGRPHTGLQLLYNTTHGSYSGEDMGGKYDWYCHYCYTVKPV